MQIWSGSSDGSVAVTDLESDVKLDTSLARSLKTPSGKGTAHVLVEHLSRAYAVQLPSVNLHQSDILLTCASTRRFKQPDFLIDLSDFFFHN